MSKQQEIAVQPSAKEREELLLKFNQMDTKVLASTFEAISMMVRAFEGKPVDAADVISRLINVKNILERSRFPTYPLLAKQVYLRLIAIYNKQAYPCKDWANFEAEALISYKGLNWDAYVEMVKAASGPQEQQQFYLGGAPQQKAEAQQMPKRHFWQKGKPKEPSEFESE